jgi:hypothetical protein
VEELIPCGAGEEPCDGREGLYDTRSKELQQPAVIVAAVQDTERVLFSHGIQSF